MSNSTQHPQRVDLDVLLTPRDAGGHEKALFGWLADAMRQDALRPRLLLPPPLEDLARAHGLAATVDRAHPITRRRDALRALGVVDRARPLLLAPGVLHAQAWLTAAAVLSTRSTWIYVPMTFRAVDMGYRHARLRDRALAPWLSRVQGFITLGERQARVLRDDWRVRGTVLTLPNRVSLRGAAPSPPALAADGRLRVGYVGRYDLHQKGLDWLVQALLDDAQLAQGCRWLFQGRGPGEALLQTLASALGPQRVEVRPYAPIEQALARADLLLLPSRYEGLPLVALEATTRGWPVVASDRAGLDELLPPRSVYRFGDRPGLKAALASLHTPSARRAAVAHARIRLLEQLPGLHYQRARAAVAAALRRAGGAA